MRERDKKAREREREGGGGGREREEKNKYDVERAVPCKAAEHEKKDISLMMPIPLLSRSFSLGRIRLTPCYRTQEDEGIEEEEKKKKKKKIMMMMMKEMEG